MSTPILNTSPVGFGPSPAFLSANLSLVTNQDLYRDKYINNMTDTAIGKKYGMSRFQVYRRLKKIEQSEPKEQTPSTDTLITPKDACGTVAATINGTTPAAFSPSLPEPGYKPAYRTRTAVNMGQAAFSSAKGKRDLPDSVDEAYDLWLEYLGYTPGKVVPPSPHVRPDGEKKIVVINDIHAPFERQDVLKDLIDNHSHDTDTLVIGGDLLDLFAVSRYEKFTQHYSLSQELRAGKALLNVLAARFPKIILMSGNHDERWIKFLSRRGMGPSELTAMNLLCRIATGDDEFDFTDPLYCLSRDLPNVELVKPVVKDFARFGFFTQIGDAIISHAEKFSRLTGQTAANAAYWFKSCALPMGICQDFRVFVQTHNHQASTAWGNFGVWNIEAGCMCLTPDYAANPKLMGAQRPTVVGYTTLYQDANGRTDMRRSRFIPFEG